MWYARIPILALTLALALASLQIPFAQAGPAEPRTLTVGLVGDIRNLDPHESVGLSQTVWINIYEPLFALDEVGRSRQALGLSHEWVDRTTLRVRLRRGVRFHDGTPWNAREAVKAIKRMIDPKDPGPDFSYFNSLVDVAAEDEYTIRVRLSRPDGLIPKIMGTSFLTMTPADHGKNLATKPVGTGPWKFVEWRSGQFVKLARNEAWWGQPKPNLEFLVFRFFQEEASRGLALLRGEIDVAFDVNPRISHWVRGIRVRSVVSDTPRILTIQINTKNPPTDDLKVRQAINLAIDKKQIIEGIAKDAAKPLRTLLPDFFEGAIDPGWLEHNPGRAATLLDEAGWKMGAGGFREKDGRPLRVRWMVAELRDPFNREIVTAAQEALRRVGIEATILFTDLVTIRRESLVADPGNYHLNGPRGFGGVSMDPIHYFLQFSSENVSPRSPGGESRYSSPDVDRLLTEYLATIDSAQRMKLLGDLQKRVYEAMPIIPLYQAKRLVVLRDYVTGFKDHPSEWDPWRYVPVSRE